MLVTHRYARCNGARPDSIETNETGGKTRYDVRSSWFEAVKTSNFEPRTVMSIGDKEI